MIMLVVIRLQIVQAEQHVRGIHADVWNHLLVQPAAPLE